MVISGVLFGTAVLGLVIGLVGLSNLQAEYENDAFVLTDSKLCSLSNIVNGTFFECPESASEKLASASIPYQFLIVASLLLAIGGLIAFYRATVKAKAAERILTESKKCPRCAEIVKSEASICRFCNFEF